MLDAGESTTVNMRVAAIREGLNDPDNRSGSSPEIIVRLADGDVSRLPALATRAFLSSRSTWKVIRWLAASLEASRAGERRDRLNEELQAFCTEIGKVQEYTGDVTATTGALQLKAVETAA